MTDQPEPVRRSDLPPIPPPEWEFHTWFPLPNGGGDLVPGQLARGVHIRRRVTYGDWQPVHPDRWADEPPTGTTAASAGRAPAADRAALSEKLWKIAEHHIIAEWICCEPLDPQHDLCAKGYAALGMAKTLLVDADPEKAWNPSAPLLDAVLAELPSLPTGPPCCGKPPTNSTGTSASSPATPPPRSRAHAS